MPKRVFSNKLVTRLTVVLTLALTPLGAITIYSEYEGWQTQRAALEASLVARTKDAVQGQHALLVSAMDAARTVAPDVIDLADDPQSCSEYLAEFTETIGLYAFAGFIESDGQMSCISSGEPQDFSGSEGLARMAENPRPNFSFQPMGSITRQPVVLANYPIVQDGDLRGIMAISVSLATFQMISSPGNPDSGLIDVVLINAKGDTLTTSGQTETTDVLPEDDQIRQFTSEPEGVYISTSRSDTERVYTLAKLVHGQLYALGSWSTEVTRASFTPNLWRIAFPGLMWIASVGAMILSVHYLVIRHLRQINSQLRRFALGNRAEFQRLPDDAPAELQEIDSTFTKMARLIRRDEIERESALQEKTVLLKEIHHRVKNNLQLIASILNLQMRRLQDAQARTILKGVQTRVRALASIHRTLYEETGVSNVDATVFLDRILRENLALVQPNAKALKVSTKLDPVVISPDKVIPVALLFSEALTNALKYVSAPAKGADPSLTITLQEQGNSVELCVRNSCAPRDGAANDIGLGRELMTAFALQIGGELDMGAVNDEHGPGWQIRLQLGDTHSDTEELPRDHKGAAS